MAIQYVYPEIYNSGQSLYPFSVAPSFYLGKRNGEAFLGKYYFTTPVPGSTLYEELDNGDTLDQIQEGVASVDYSGLIQLAYNTSWANTYPNRNFVNLKTGKSYINPDSINLRMVISGGPNPSSPSSYGAGTVIASCSVKDSVTNSLLGICDFELKSGGITTETIPLLLANEMLVPSELNVHIDNIRGSGSTPYLETQYRIYALELQLSGTPLIDDNPTLSLFGDVDLVTGKNLTWYDGEHGYYRELYENFGEIPIPTIFNSIGSESYHTDFDKTTIFNMGLYDFTSSGAKLSSGVPLYNTDKTKYCLAFPNMAKTYDGVLLDSGTLITRFVSNIGVSGASSSSITYEHPSPIYHYSYLNNATLYPDLFFSDTLNDDVFNFRNLTYIQGNALYLGYSTVQEYHETSDGINYDSSIQYQNSEWLTGFQRKVTFYDLVPKSGDFAVYLNMTELASEYDSQSYNNAGTTYVRRDYNDIIRNERFSLGVDKNEAPVFTADFYNFILTDLSDGTSVSYSLPYSAGATYNEGDVVSKQRIKSFLINYSGNTMDVYGMFYGINGMNKIMTKTINNITSSGIMICDAASASSRYLFEVGGKSGCLTQQEITNLYNSINAPLNHIAHDIADYDSGVYAYVNYPEHVGKNYFTTEGVGNIEPVGSIGLNTKHYASNLLTLNNRLDYEIVQNTPVIMTAIMEYTGTHPSGLNIRPAIFIDGNNQQDVWLPSGQYLFNSGITTLTFSGNYANNLPYPLASGAELPMMGIKVLTPGLSGLQTYNGGQLKIYAVDLRADVLEADPTGTISTIPLYTEGDAPTSGNITLYLEAEEKQDRLNLFIKGEGGEPNKALPLSIWTVGSSSGETTKTCTLTTFSAIQTSGDMLLYLEADYAEPVRFNTGQSTPFPLYLHSYAPSGNLNLFLYHRLVQNSGRIPLYTKSSVSPDTSISLHISGGGIDDRTDSITLHTTSYINLSGNVPLITLGNTSFANLNLYIGAEDVATLNSGTTLFTSSALDSGIYKGVELFMQSDEVTGGMPLTIKVGEDAENSDSMYLFLMNDTTTNKDVILYIHNDIEQINSTTKLYVAGTGENFGAHPINGNMNLFINRDDEGTSSVVQLYTKGPDGSSSQVPLIIKGGTITENSVYLNIPSTSALKNSGTTLFSHGF